MTKFFKYLSVTSLTLAISLSSHAGEREIVRRENLQVSGTGTGADASQPTENLEGNWDLNDLYPSVAVWEQALADIKNNLQQIKPVCEGSLGENSATLAHCLDNMYGNYRQVLRLYTYAMLVRDTDLGNSGNGERFSRAQLLLNQYYEITSFVEPELISIGRETLKRWLSEQEDLGDYDHLIRNTLRKSSYILSSKEERLLAAAADPMGSATNTFSIFTNAELPWPSISLAPGTTLTLNASQYTRYRSSEKRSDRKLVFDAFFGAYESYRETLASTLSGEIKRQVFTARMRGYQSTLQQALASDNIPEQVYHTLIETVNDNLDSLHRYLKLHSGHLGIENPQYYDVYPSAVNNPNTYSIADASRILNEALKPLGAEYGTLLSDALKQNWIHPYPSKGKRSGAYVMGAAYDVHPYMLLNHNNNFDSLSTYAHEWGHAIHTLLSNAAQPFPKAAYPTFIAEIASTANEILLFNYLSEQASSDEERLFYLFQELQGLRGTFFRQTQFAEFELTAHREIERGEALSGDKLKHLYGAILKRYHGHDQGVMTIDELYTMEWAYIPHFYRNFYVYQYATSISAAYYLVERIIEQEDRGAQQYLSILQAGGSDYPYDILKRAGVDMASPEVYLAVIRRFEKIMDEIEVLKSKTSKPKTPAPNIPKPNTLN